MSDTFAQMEALFEESRKTPEYVMEGAIEQAIESIENLMERRGMSAAALARAMDVSRARVHDILHGYARNFTLRTLATVAVSLGCELSVNFVSCEEAIAAGYEWSIAPIPTVDVKPVLDIQKVA